MLSEFSDIVRREKSRVGLHCDGAELRRSSMLEEDYPKTARFLLKVCGWHSNLRKSQDSPDSGIKWYLKRVPRDYYAF